MPEATENGVYEITYNPRSMPTRDLPGYIRSRAVRGGGLAVLVEIDWRWTAEAETSMFAWGCEFERREGPYQPKPKPRQSRELDLADKCAEFEARIEVLNECLEVAVHDLAMVYRQNISMADPKGSRVVQKEAAANTRDMLRRTLIALDKNKVPVPRDLLPPWQKR